MRQLTSVLSLMLAGLLVVLSVAGWQVDQLLRTQEPIEQIAGDLPERSEFSEAASEMIVTQVTESLPSGIAALVPSSAEQAVNAVVSSTISNERTSQAWAESLDSTRSQYVQKLETLFANGTSGDTSELDIELELSPVAAAITEPLRSGLEDAFDWIPGVDASNFEFLAPEVVVDIAAVTEDDADPYLWATGAQFSQYWLWGVAAGAILLILGLVLGRGRQRWISLGLGALLSVILGVIVLNTAASPQLTVPGGSSSAVGQLLTVLQSRIADWAQPVWWWLIGASAVVLLVCLVLISLSPRRYRPQDHHV